jgi:hypothetical protein
MHMPSVPIFRTTAGARLAQLLVLQLLVDEALGRRFDSIPNCRDRVIAANATTPNLNLTFLLTLPQCYEYCGTSYGTYDIWSVVSALTSWVIPLFLLLGNVTYAKIPSSVFDTSVFGMFKIHLGYVGNWIAVISHLLANPVNFLWSLCLKLDVGRRIKIRCYRIHILSEREKKNLSAICFALEDFENGIHVDTVLEPLEDEWEDFGNGVQMDIPLQPLQNTSTRDAHHSALRAILSPAARDLADARKHNKLHSTLAILIYGKEVFEALINAKLDGTFPYHMPHTLALRQIYYWLFLAIILSGAAGGFANQWTSQAILRRFLKGRREALEELKLQNSDLRYQDVVLESLEPWNGGNYSWKRHKGEFSDRSAFLLFLVVLSVALPVLSAFLISWFTPTVGLGDRGIMELSFAGLWLFNWAFTQVVSKFLHDGRSLFKIMWWNLFWSLASLVVLFAAFQGELLKIFPYNVFTVHE